MKCCTLLVVLLFIAGHVHSAPKNPAKPAAASEKTYKISYIPNMALHDMYFKPAGSRKVPEAFNADSGWSWHFTTAIMEGKAEQNLVRLLEDKYPDKSVPEYMTERRNFEQTMLKTLKESMYPPSDKTLMEEMVEIFKPYKVFLSESTILAQWELQLGNDLTAIKNALHIDSHGSDGEIRDRILKKIEDTLIAQDQSMNLEDAITDLQAKLDIQADPAPTAEALRLKSIMGQLYHEYKKAGSMSVEKFYRELISMTKALGGVELTGVHDLITEDQRVQVKELQKKINEHFKEVARTPRGESKWKTLLHDFYAQHPNALPFKMSVRQILPNLFSLEEVELVFHPTENKLVKPELASKGKPSGRPSATDDIKEIVQISDNIGNLEMVFISVDPELGSVHKFYDMNRAQLDRVQQVKKLMAEAVKIKEDIVNEQTKIKSNTLKGEEDPAINNLITKLKTKAEENVNKLKQGTASPLDWTAEDKRDFKKVQVHRGKVLVEVSERDVVKKSKALEKAQKELQDALEANADEATLNRKRKTVKGLQDGHQAALKKVDVMKEEKVKFENDLADMELLAKSRTVAGVETDTFRFVTHQGHEAVVRVDTAFSDGSEAADAEPTNLEDIEHSVGEKC